MTTTVRFPSLPQNILLSLDLISLTTTPAFYGIRNVPSGLHFVFTGTDAGLAIRHGIWFEVTSGSGRGNKEVIFRWEGEEERLVMDEVDEGVVSVRSIEEGQRRGLRDQLGGGLVDYNAPKDSSESDLVDWRSLTRYITSDILSRILLPQHPPSDTTHPTPPQHPTHYTITSTSSSPQDAETEIPGLNPSDFGESSTSNDREALTFLPIDLKRTWRTGAIGRERTEQAQDRSWALSHLLDQAGLSSSSSPSFGNSDESTTNTTNTTTTTDSKNKIRQLGAKSLLGEFQFCFLCTILLGNYSSLAHWRRITGLLFTSVQAVTEILPFFVTVVQTLKEQVRCLSDSVEGEEEGMVEIRDEFVAGGGRLRKLLEGWRKGVGDGGGGGGGGGALGQEIKSLFGVLREEFGWEDVGETVLKRGMVELEDGELVELTVDGADEEDELGEYAPVVVEE